MGTPMMIDESSFKGKLDDQPENSGEDGVSTPASAVREEREKLPVEGKLMVLGGSIGTNKDENNNQDGDPLDPEKLKRQMQTVSAKKRVNQCQQTLFPGLFYHAIFSAVC
jgi:hypothetical protein